MNAALKTKWIEALRSGEFAQGVGELCSISNGLVEHCCLGVLGEVAGIPREQLLSKDHLSTVGRDDLLGPWVDGNFNADREYTHTSLQRKLAAMNDSDCEFTEIADWIETNVPAEA